MNDMILILNYSDTFSREIALRLRGEQVYGRIVSGMTTSAQIADLISALIIYLCGFVLFIKNFMEAHAAKKEERTKRPAAGDAGKGGDQ